MTCNAAPRQGRRAPRQARRRHTAYRCASVGPPLRRSVVAPSRAGAARPLPRRRAPGGDVLGPTDHPGEPRPTDAPRPGDPRAGGPRPRAAGRDLVWAGLVVALVLITVGQLAGLVLTVVRLEVAPSGGALFLGFVVTVVWLVTIFWLAMGAWRRSVWGCPFEHDADAPAARRCRRHAGVPPTPHP
jgi:hypothetical protein